MVAIEISRILNPNFTILISSITKPNELPHWKKLGNLGLLNLIPNKLMKPPQLIFNFLFSADNRILLKEIVDDTKPQFIRWALNAIIKWKSEYIPPNLLRIHGTNDRLIPLKGKAECIKGGGHFMIVDQADSISKIINIFLQENGMKGQKSL